jgi:ERCC4-type nuclease
VLYVDRRIGSAEFAKLLADLRLPIAITTLAYGDFAFLGTGDAGAPVPIGIERKTIEDFTSSMWSGRLPGHQLPGLLQAYEDIWIVLEGVWRTNFQTGAVEVPKGPKKWRQIEAGSQVLSGKGLEAMMLTLELRGGVRFRHTRSKLETGRFLSSLYRWWTDGEGASGHHSHLRLSSTRADKALLHTPSLCRVVAAQLPQVGWGRSGPVSRYFKTTEAMVNAPIDEWLKIEGIGQGIALKVWQALRSEKPDA